MSVEVTRIYQGRVVSCKDEQGKNISNFEDLLFQHHQLFQDAVNYYLFALTAMSLENDPVFGKIKKQLREEVWNDFERDGEIRPGLKHTMYRIYSRPEILDSENGFAFTETLVLDNTSVDPEILQKALNDVVKQCSQGNDIAKPGRTYLPMLCKTDFSGTFPNGKKALQEALGVNKLIDALYSENPLEKIKLLIPEMEISWSTFRARGTYIEGKKGRERLKKAIEFFLSDEKKAAEETNEFLKTCGKDRLNFYLNHIESLGNIRFGSNAGKASTPLDPVHALWLLRFFPDEYTVNLMRTILKENNRQPLPPGEDFIEMSRGKRGYVFKFFTVLAIGNIKSAWTDFDIDAFKAALTVINQFNTKTKERNEECEKYLSVVEWMEGKSALSRPPHRPEIEEGEEGEESISGLPKLTTDPRWCKLHNLLNNELAVQNCWTEDEVVEYGLSERTIRSFSALKKEWNTILAAERAKRTDESLISKMLKDALDKFQSEHSDVMGSAALFQALCRPENICIWEECGSKAKYASENILQDSAIYSNYKQKIRELEEPIRLTPADAFFSRRPCDLLAISGGKGNKEFGHNDKNVFIAKLAVKKDGKYQAVKIIINYSAPRLRRDELCADVAGHFYLPPVLQALFPDQKIEQHFNPDVFLMPDWDKDGHLRVLLNFPVKLIIDKLYDNFEQRFRRDNEFLTISEQKGVKTKHFLVWPDYKYGKIPGWYESGESFTLVSVDLGQRSAGGLVRIMVSTVRSKHSVFIGNDGKRDWYAKRVYSELLRLPGEDSKVCRNGNIVKEEYGKNGRRAEPLEKDETIEIFRRLQEDERMLYPDGKDMIPYFPVLNDKLLIAFRRAIGKLKLLDRWLWMSSDEKNREKVIAEMNSAIWLPVKTMDFIRNEEKTLRQLLPEILIKIANRILPVRGKSWNWQKKKKDNEKNIYYWQLCLIDAPENKPKVRGQRGLSFARLTQLEELRKRCQALNRVLMREPGEAPQTVAQMRELVIPDCCPEILRRLEEMKEQRINQTANMIFAQALGVRHKVHTASRSERAENGIHGEYEKIPGVEPAAFIVLENLSRYRFSQDRSPYENSRLMKWAHRALVQKLKMLCEVIGIPVLEVNAAYSSRFSAENIPGFRADECRLVDLDGFYWRNKKLSSKAQEKFEAIRRNHEEMCKYDPYATSLMPQDGGEIFVPFAGSDDLKQADINAAFNIGLRAVANRKQTTVNNRLSAEKKKGVWQVKRKSKFDKIIYPEDVKIVYDADVKSAGGNFFIIPCSPQILGFEDEKIPQFAEGSTRTDFLMFGSFIWSDKNLERKLERCLQLNKLRLKKLADEPESVF